MGLNLTSTKPSVTETLFLTHQGNVPCPDCFSTLGLLGAVGSASTAHFGAPRPVTPATQSAGRPPGFVLSKVSVSAIAMVAVRSDKTAANLNPMSDLLSYWICWMS